METQSQHLTVTQCNELVELLQKFVYLFDGTLGDWGKYPVDFKLKEDLKPIYSRPYPVPDLY